MSVLSDKLLQPTKVRTLSEKTHIVPWALLVDMSFVDSSNTYEENKMFYISMSSQKFEELVDSRITITHEHVEVVETEEIESKPKTPLQLCEELRVNFVKYTRPGMCMPAFTQAYKKRMMIGEEIKEAFRSLALSKELHKYGFIHDEFINMLEKAERAPKILKYIKRLPDDLIIEVLNGSVSLIEECFRRY